MFESIKQNGRLDRMKCVSSLLVSLIVHVALVSVLVLVPLIFCDVLHPDEFITFLMAAPALPERPVPPTPPSPAAARKPPEIATGCRDCAPERIPPGIPSADLEPPDIDLSPSGSLAAGINPDGISPQGAAKKVKWDDLLASAGPRELPVPKRPILKEPVPVVGTLQESKLIVKVAPTYPELARRTRTSGVVLLEAIIDEDGNVTNLQVISGHPLLVGAARDAVLQWKYSPTIMNGEAVPVKAVVKVTFQIR